MFAQFKPALVMMILMTVLTGIVYPLLVTAVSQVGQVGQGPGFHLALLAVAFAQQHRRR